MHVRGRHKGIEPNRVTPCSLTAIVGLTLVLGNDSKCVWLQANFFAELLVLIVSPSVPSLAPFFSLFSLLYGCCLLSPKRLPYLGAVLL